MTGYVTAILSVAVISLITLLARPFIRPITIPLFLAAIVFTAWRHGRNPALLTTLLSGLVYVFISPRFRLSGHWNNIGRAGLFMIEGAILCWLIDSRLRAEQEVRQSREELRALYGDLQSLVERERARIAREVHDELGTQLTELKFEVSFLKERSVKSDSMEIGKFDETLHHVDNAIASVRRIATELRPAVLDTLGLTAAIEWQAKEFEVRTGIKCQLVSMAEDLSPDPERDTTVFRVFQESLTNVARHANATTVQINLERNSKDLRLFVKDDGCGISINNSSAQHGLGILGMRERIRMLNGVLRISGRPGSGTLVQVSIPLLSNKIRAKAMGHD